MIEFLQAWPNQICIAFVLDLVLGDPDRFFHPVRWMGKAIIALENPLRRMFPNQIQAGIALVVVLVAGTVLSVLILLFLADAISPWLGGAVRIYLLYACLSARCLAVEVRRVLAPLRRGDISEARYWLSRIVGRDTEDLDEKEILRASVETTAESTVDGIVSVLFYSFLGGAVLAMVFKAVSTLDSMVGYKNERYNEFGRASARLDDALNYIPARLGAALIAVAGWFLGLSPSRAWSVVLRDAKNQPSPNSGYPEAAFAGALGVRLGGSNAYAGVTVVKAALGDPVEELSIPKVEQSLRLMFAASALAVVVGIFLSAFAALAFEGEASAAEQSIGMLSESETRARIVEIVRFPYRLLREGSIKKQKRTSLRILGENSESMYRHIYVDIRDVKKSKTPIKIDGYATEEVFLEWSGEPFLDKALTERCEALKTLSSRAHPSQAWTLKFYHDAFQALQTNQPGKFQKLFRKARQRYAA